MEGAETVIQLQSELFTEHWCLLLKEENLRKKIWLLWVQFYKHMLLICERMHIELYLHYFTFLQLWETRITAGCEEHNMTYPLFREGLVRCNILLNRKTLADLAVWEPRTFKVSFSLYYNAEECT